MKFVFTKYASRQFLKLPLDVQERIREKLLILRDKKVFVSQVKKVLDISPATHRVRIGSYRILLEWDRKSKEVVILKVGYRREVYK